MPPRTTQRSRSRHCYAIKAIGLEPQIEPWLAIFPTVLLVASETEASSRQQHDSAKKENPKSLPTLPGLESRAKIFAPSSRRGVFSLDSPLYRTRLPKKWSPGTGLGRFCDLPRSSPPGARCFSQSVDRCKVCNRGQYLTSLYALLKDQTKNLRQELHQQRQTCCEFLMCPLSSTSYFARAP